MVSYFPKQIALRAISVYIIALAIVSLVYLDYAMDIIYYVLGLLCVVSFFLLSNTFCKRLNTISNSEYYMQVLLLAVTLRLLWVVFSYFYYISATGVPFEFSSADAIGYHEVAEWLSTESWDYIRGYYFGPGSIGISDTGYPIYLTVIYKVFGPIIIIPRIIKALLSSITCMLIYKLSSRTFGETVGRVSGIMCALMPNLIIYCGYHLKETEMIFLEVAFLERLDFLIRNRRYSFFSILLPSVLAGSLFFFRTVLGAAAAFSFATTVLLSSAQTMKSGLKRIVLVAWGVLCLFVFSGGTAMTEAEALWEERDNNVEKKRTEQTLRGNQWAHYATGTVMAPLSVVLPFATMINVDEQYSQNEKHGGNYIRNFMGFFALLAVYEAIRRKNWRNYALIGSFIIAYLGVVSMSGFSNSERFLLPALPGLIMMWAYGLSVLRRESYSLLTPWCFIVIVMEIGWAYFKLGSRGLL